MKNQTGVSVKATKVVESDGEIGYLITKVKALNVLQLPALYLQGKKPIVYKSAFSKKAILCCSDKGKPLYFGEMPGALEGKIMSIDDFLKLMIHIKNAGKNLTDINAKLDKQKEEWNGTVVFVDGQLRTKGMPDPIVPLTEFEE